MKVLHSVCQEKMMSVGDFRGWCQWFEFLPCFDTVGWVTKRASACEILLQIFPEVLF